MNLSNLKERENRMKCDEQDDDCANLRTRGERTRMYSKNSVLFCSAKGGTRTKKGKNKLFDDETKCFLGNAYSFSSE